MKTCKTVLIIFAVLLFTHQVKAEENHWQIIRGYLVAGNELSKKRASSSNSDELKNCTKKGKEVAKEYRKYLDSLTAEQLIVAARQCSVEVEQHNTNPEEWDMASMALAFFWQYYPLKTNNLEDISPLLDDLKDKSQSPFWRNAIMQLLGVEWHRELRDKPELRLDAAYAMNAILTDTSEPIFLRVKAARESGKFFRRAHKWNLSRDIEINRLIEKGRKYSDVIKDAEIGKVMVASETVEKNKQIEAAIAKSIKAQINIFSEPNLPAYLGLNLIGSLKELRGFDETGQIKEAMSNALQNYRNYDEYLWRYLVRTNVVYFDNKDVNPVLEKMIEDVKDVKTEGRNPQNRSDLLKLQKDIDNGKIEGKPYVPGSSLVNLPKPQLTPAVTKPAEPVDVNELVK